jgi:ArsR family transcriptional regulator, lead/cadmium/zinc/bismuth-responsive transcriptional repressor
VVPRTHEHPVDAERVEAARAGVLSLEEAGQLAGLLGMLADPVRSRILFALVTAGELCVGDLALALDVTEDQVSYGLKMLRLAGLVSFRRDGRMVCYRLSDGFPHQLLEHCLRQLLTIAAPPHADPAESRGASPQPGTPARQAGNVQEADRAGT